MSAATIWSVAPGLSQRIVAAQPATASIIRKGTTLRTAMIWSAPMAEL
jgi:hypothetical protein